MKKFIIGLMLLIFLFISTAPALSCCWKKFYPNQYTMIIKYDCDCNGWAEYGKVFKKRYGKWIYIRTIYYY